MCVASLSTAAPIVLTDTIAMQITDYTKNLTFAQFDTMGGTRQLDSVSFSIAGSIVGTAQVESFDNKASTIVTTLSATLSLTDALSNVLVITVPTITNTFNATAHDGLFDYSGLSGMSYFGLTTSAFKAETYTDVATKNFFTGSGTSMFTFDAKARSFANGSGNLKSLFTMEAGGVVTVTYAYTDGTSTAVSAPSHLAMMGFGILAVAGLRKVRK